MNQLKIAQKGASILEIIAEEVTKEEMGSFWIESFIQAMYETMMQQNGVGIAAPQVYLSKRIIIVASKPNVRYPDAPEMSPICMINPVIIEKSEHLLSGEEGCLSVPIERGIVLRSEMINLKYYTQQGEEVIERFEGFPARIIQHEIDHLNGILFVDRL